MSGAVLLGTDKAVRHRLEARTTVGRSEANDIVITADGVSRFHAEVVQAGTGHRLTDLGSRNGTFVNGEPVSPDGHILSDGDLVVFGGVEGFRYLDPGATPIVPRIGKLQGVWIDPDTDAVWVDAHPVEPELSARQFHLLQMLVAAEGRPVERRDIVSAVWADVDARGVSDDAVTALIKRLRSRLREAAPESDYVDIVRGRGVRLLDPDRAD
ncbi:MAG: FHA domain-containing protein [Actinomycetota bacterium]